MGPNETDETDEPLPIEESQPNDPWTDEQLEVGGRPVDDGQGHHGWQRIDGRCEFAASQYERDDD